MVIYSPREKTGTSHLKLFSDMITTIVLPPIIFHARYVYVFVEDENTCKAAWDVFRRAKSGYFKLFETGSDLNIT